MRTPAQRLVAILGTGLAVGLLLLGLRQLASTLTASHLRHRSEQMLAAAQAGQPLWQWRLHKPGDLVAGRAFGAADVRAGNDGLRIASRDGSPFELGLPLAQTIDLLHWPLLRVQGHGSAAGTLDLTWRDSAERACLATGATLPAGDLDLTIDLRALRGHSAQGGCTAPSVATMLRLRPRIPAGARLELRRVALLAAPPGPAMAAPAPPGQAPSMNASGGNPQADPAMPRVRLPGHASAESLLQRRDMARARWPAALLQPGEQPLSASPPAPSPAWMPTTASGLYLLGLLWLWRRRPQSDGRAGRLLELSAILVGPLWLIAGLQWGSDRPLPALAAFVGALLFAFARRDGARPWRWFGRWQDAAWAGWPVLAAVALVLAWGHSLQAPGWRGALVYLLWATLQQWLMLTVVLPRLERLLPWSGMAVLAAATLFALLHTPNGALMQLCLLAEAWWAWGFLRGRSLLSVAVAHAACALLVQAGLAGGALRSLEVSARFFQ
ncbi:hypothetical protein ASG87_05270 [Frateuria sp. Soil773]|uniref:CPBP family glutamic-type intramembrane protease n=1 Tax=Frateuria sp. Soil773 TaxID=1736407 RepID=UPI0006FAC147|nr:CPBP family glutamic-type intramembrane protease [Frateuria sp. Soil773]KRE88970.1 hypothetical protein ASG87_05270 [Frateuria sp. Soil773]